MQVDTSIFTIPWDHVPEADPTMSYYEEGGLTFGEIADHVARYTYKPGWDLYVESLAKDDLYNKHGLRPGEMCRLTFDAHVPDARGPDAHLPHNHDLFLAHGSIDIPLGLTLPSLHRVMRWYSEYREIHELREWLKYDGDPIDYPPH